MAEPIKKIFGLKEETVFIPPERQNPSEVEDYSVRKVLNTQEGTIEKTPVNPNDIVNKAYADSIGGLALGETDSTAYRGDRGKTAYDHSQDNTQAHTDYLLNSEADSGVGLTLSGDNSSADTAYVPMVLYNTDATPPAANTVPIGTIYIQYTP